MILPIVKEPHPVLHRKGIPVREIASDVQDLIQSMIETMHVADGVGLAANQVESSFHVLVASPDGKKGRELVLINATVLKRQGRARSPEGCLSLPGISSEVTRSAKVTVSGLNRQGVPVTLSADGLLAKILQHEIDHLEGRLFPDRLRWWHRHRLLRKYHFLAATLSRVQI